jgi:transposase-like protein
MITQVLHCPYCQGIDIVKHGLSSEGKQRYRCRTCLEGRGRTFLLEYSYAGQSPAVKQQIVDMAMNASGIRDTARVLHVSPTTVINELKKRRVFHRCGFPPCGGCVEGGHDESALPPLRCLWESWPNTDQHL